MPVIRDKHEIDVVLKQAEEAVGPQSCIYCPECDEEIEIDRGYAEGVLAMWQWLTGETHLPPNCK